MAIKRIWHGWTSPENANAYQELLHREIFPGIEAKQIKGYHCVELLRTDQKDEVEFITIMTFAELKDVKNFQGKDYEKAYVPEAARKLLKRWDKTAAHLEVIETRKIIL
jgi:hypothetical protein